MKRGPCTGRNDCLIVSLVVIPYQREGLPDALPLASHNTIRTSQVTLRFVSPDLVQYSTWPSVDKHTS